jgi:hypothetical protein
MPRLDAAIRNIVIGLLEAASPRMQLLHVITFIEARFHGFGNGTSNQARQMTSMFWTSSHHKSYTRSLHLDIPAKEHNCNSI